MAEQYGLKDHVVFHGYVSEEEKVNLLQQAWVLVTASAKEGWGLVVIEANACGTPAVAFNVPGLCEAIDSPASGVLVDDKEEFTGAVLRILEDEDHRGSLSRRALKRAGQFSWDRSASQFLDILKRQVPDASTNEGFSHQPLDQERT
jgi:glycosyltransferase involved in cell wall biosynthesis